MKANTPTERERRSLTRLRSALKAKGYSLRQAHWDGPVRGEMTGGWHVYTLPVSEVIVGINLKDVLSQIREMPHASIVPA